MNTHEVDTLGSKKNHFLGYQDDELKTDISVGNLQVVKTT